MTTSGTTAITIDSIANYFGGRTTNALIAFIGTDPYSALTPLNLPSGFSGSLVDDGVGTIYLVITSGPAIKSDEWAGGMNNQWDTPP